jgi:hypothetical protein
MYRCCCNFVLLPQENMTSALAALTKIVDRRHPNHDGLRAMLGRITHWIENVGPKFISVFRAGSRTNNGCESFWSHLTRYAKKHESSFNVWELIGQYIF